MKKKSPSLGSKCLLLLIQLSIKYRSLGRFKTVGIFFWRVFSARNHFLAWKSESWCGQAKGKKILLRKLTSRKIDISSARFCTVLYNIYNKKSPTMIQSRLRFFHGTEISIINVFICWDFVKLKLSQKLWIFNFEMSLTQENNSWKNLWPFWN